MKTKVLLIVLTLGVALAAGGNRACVPIEPEDPLCDPAAEWWRDYVVDDPVACAAAFFGCPEPTEMFHNDCGCGCEQSEDCPEYVDCMPPSPPECAITQALCPYTTVLW